MDRILLVFVAGGLGAIGRWGIQRCAVHWFGASVFGTLTVNLVGSFLFGWVWSMANEARHPWFVGPAGVTILVGFLGAFTTFSTLAFEAERLLEQQRFGALCAYLVGQNLSGIASVALGIALARARY